MRSRFPLVSGSAALFCLGLAGCGDMLGLNGLSFEERSGGSDVATATGGTGGHYDFGLGSGGSAGGAPHSDFPDQWEPGLVLATAPTTDGGVYLSYSPADGVLKRFTSDPDAADFVKSHTVAQGWSHVLLIPLPTNDEPDSGAGSAEASTWDSVGVLVYDTNKELPEFFVPPFDSEEMTGTRHHGSAGRTHFVLLPGEAEPNLLAYNKTDGSVRVGRAIPQTTQGEVTTHEWSTDWDELVPWKHAGEHGVLKLDFDGEVAEFEAFVGLGQGMEPRFSLPLEGPWTAAMSFVSPDHGQRLIVYDSETGAVRSLGISAAEQPSTFSSGSEKWPTRITSLQLLHTGSAIQALTYSGVTGVVGTLPLDPLASSDIIVK